MDREGGNQVFSLLCVINFFAFSLKNLDKSDEGSIVAVDEVACSLWAVVERRVNKAAVASASTQN